MEAPKDCIVSFSTQAGKPAIAPSSPDQMTFYTQALINQFSNATDQTSFDELLYLVKREVRETMQNHPVAPIRQLAQDPFIADNSRNRVLLATAIELPDGSMGAPANLAEALQWKQIEQSDWPPEVIRQCDIFLARFPQSEQVELVKIKRDGAKNAVLLLSRRDIKLYRSSFAPPEDVTLNEREIRKAAQGDKDAAARIARGYRQSSIEQAAFRYEGWLQFAAGLGNGIAAYELALFYRDAGQPQAAAEAEAKAIELGYTPPLSLEHTRK
ncbi:MAG: hypothetical protein HC848_10390 [Limnobacter sp.]|nr:hypothetical protein [Limnobacter sp.]